MSNAPIKKVLLGDKTVAAKWLPYARQFFKWTETLGLQTETRVVDTKDNVVIRVITKGVRAIYISAHPTVHAIVGWPYDNNNYSGWGNPYTGDSVDYGYEDPVKAAVTPPAQRETPIINYGTPASVTAKEVGISAATSGAQVYRGLDLLGVAGTDEIQYGVTDWRSSDGSVIISWDGLPSRHTGWCYSQQSMYYGVDCAEGALPPRLGGYFTKGTECLEIPALRNNGLYYITKNVYDFETNNFLTDLSPEYKSAFSNKIYKDGNLLHEVDPRYVVTGACLKRMFKGWYVVAIVSDWSSDNGNIREYLYVCNLGQTYKNAVIRPLEDNGSSITTASGDYSLGGCYFEEQTTNPDNPDYETYASRMRAPEYNMSLWSFNSDGTKAVAIRSYIVPDDFVWNNSSQIQLAPRRYVLELDINFTNFNDVSDYSVQLSLVRHFASSVGDTNEGYKEGVDPDTKFFVRRFIGTSSIFAVDFVDDEIVTAQTFDVGYVFNRDATSNAQSGTVGDEENNLYVDIYEEVRIVKGVDLYTRSIDTMPVINSFRAEDYEAFYEIDIDDITYSFDDAFSGQTIYNVNTFVTRVRDKLTNTGGEIYAEQYPGYPCLYRRDDTASNYMYLHHVDLRVFAMTYSREEFTPSTEIAVGDSYISKNAIFVGFFPGKGTEFDSNRYLFLYGKNFLSSVGGQKAQLSTEFPIGEVIPDYVMCPEIVNNGLDHVLSVKRINDAAAPHVTMVSPIVSANFNWIRQGNLLYIVHNGDTPRPYGAGYITNFWVFSLTGSSVSQLSSQSVADTLGIGTQYKGTSAAYTVLNKNWLQDERTLQNTNDPFLVDGGFTRLGVI